MTRLQLPIDYLVVFVCLIPHKDDTYTDRKVLHGFYSSGFCAVSVLRSDVECKLIIEGDEGTDFGSKGKLPPGIRGTELSQVGF